MTSSDVKELVERLEVAAELQHRFGRHAAAQDLEAAASALTLISEEREELRTALLAAEKADKIHTKCEECMEIGQAAEACGDCFPSADDARVMRRNVLAKIKKAARAALKEGS